MVIGKAKNVDELDERIRKQFDYCFRYNIMEGGYVHVCHEVIFITDRAPYQGQIRTYKELTPEEIQSWKDWLKLNIGDLVEVIE